MTFLNKLVLGTAGPMSLCVGLEVRVFFFWVMISPQSPIPRAVSWCEAGLRHLLQAHNSGIKVPAASLWEMDDHFNISLAHGATSVAGASFLIIPGRQTWVPWPVGTYRLCWKVGTFAPVAGLCSVFEVLRYRCCCVSTLSCAQPVFLWQLCHVLVPPQL